MKKSILAAAVMLVAACGAYADAGVDRMQNIMEAIKQGDTGQLPAATAKAVETGAQSATKSADLSKTPAAVTQFAVEQSGKWEQMAREAYVAALPPRDQALGRSLLLGDGTLPGASGRLYIFVSRSMPLSLLKAYSLDAMYLGADLVVKGIRKGDTVKEYLEEALTGYNNAEGQIMAGMEINPNLYDMFNVTVVPSVVWTNRIGLEDIGSGCQDLPEGSKLEKVSFPGPDETPVQVDKPTCAPAPASSFYKISGALNLSYVMDRFEEAGLPKEAIKTFRDRLAVRQENVNDGSRLSPQVGNAMTGITTDFKLDVLPKSLLRYWDEQLKTKNVQRGPVGPNFSPDEDDDPIYRKELTDKIHHGLGL